MRTAPDIRNELPSLLPTFKKPIINPITTKTVRTPVVTPTRPNTIARMTPIKNAQLPIKLPVFFAMVIPPLQYFKAYLI